MSLFTILLTFTALLTNTIKAQLLCESELENKNNSCCFPNCRMDCVQLCPEEYFLIHNNSKVLCSRKGEIEDIQMFNTHFSGKPFCARTCPDGFQASVFTCIECKTPCNVQKLVKFSNTTETHTKHKTFEMKIIAVVSSVAVVAIVAIVISVIVCCLVKKRYSTSCGTEQTKHINREASEIELGNKNGVKLADSENVEDPDGRRRMVNGYVTDPTTGIKREDGIDNDAYDYAHFRIVPRKAYIQQERYENDDDGDGYEEYTGPFTAATEQNTEEIYVNQTLTTENLNETLQRNPSDHQKKENAKKDQIPLGECNNYENVENEDCNFINQSQINNCKIYENIKLNVNTIEKVVNVQSKSVNAKTVNEFTSFNTNTINIDHAENMNIHNTTIVQFINVKVEKPAKESDKKSKTW